MIDQVVRDLAGELGEVRPIELQVVGAQLQTDNITTLEKYQQLGANPKEKLVQLSLEEVVKDCGQENERAARLVLYLLTNENNTRPLKTHEKLIADLTLVEFESEIEKLDLVLEVLVGSGLVLEVPESPDNCYQLVHDYLVSFIRVSFPTKLDKLKEIEIRQKDIQTSLAKAIGELSKEREEREAGQRKIEEGQRKIEALKQESEAHKEALKQKIEVFEQEAEALKQETKARQQENEARLQENEARLQENEAGLAQLRQELLKELLVEAALFALRIIFAFLVAWELTKIMFNFT